MSAKTRLITLSRTDAEFSSYLLGTFSKKDRALPIQSLNANTPAETVTFQVIPLEAIETPGFLAKWIEIFKFRSFLLMAFPLFAILTKNLLDEVPMDGRLVLFCVLSAFSLLVGANLLNDYFDHMRGLDRIHPDQQRKPIQKGWVTAAATRHWAVAYLLVGIALGLPAVAARPQVLWVAAIPAGAALGAWLTRQKGLKFRRGAEFLVFLLVGPLLTVGFQLAISGQADPEALWIGILTGWFAVFLLHLKNFESLLVNAQAGLQSTVVRWGFDRSRVFLAAWWILFLVNFAAYHFIYSMSEWFYASLICPAAFSLPFFRHLRRLTSPVGSEIKRLATIGRTVAVLCLGFWIIENLWWLMVVEIDSTLN